ncbi:GntR family transcriptional regulator [Paracoccus sp. (in: a-proteobacteria)]|uniref:GntR family transcriptional regulator n=1 Tax=Paracoccus sp. TaxID=267 RepID=UPI003A8B49E0
MTGGERPASPGDLTSVAYERIEELFISLRVLPGASLRTQDLQNLTGLGRTPVHQAVRRLAAETILDVLPRNGLRVAPIDLAREKRLAVLRRDMDRFVLTAAIRNMDSNERARLGHILRLIEEEREDISLDRFNMFDKAFDMLVMQAARERFLDSSLRPLKAFARRSGYLDIRDVSGAGGLRDSVDRHTTIMRAVMRGDVAGACAGSDHLVELGLAMLDRLGHAIDPALLDIRFQLGQSDST